jgi:hypothetical protein
MLPIDFIRTYHLGLEVARIDGNVDDGQRLSFASHRDAYVFVDGCSESSPDKLW